MRQADVRFFFGGADAKHERGTSDADDAAAAKVARIDDAAAVAVPRDAQLVFTSGPRVDDEPRFAMTGTDPPPGGAALDARQELDEQTGDTEKIVSFCSVGDGELEITTNKRKILIFKDAAGYLQSINKLRNLKINGRGYICSGQAALHQLVGDKFCKTDAQVREQYPEHFKAYPNDITVIMHLDNDKLNFNIANLKRGPQVLNFYMKMSQPVKSGNGFYGFVTVNKKQENTKTVATAEEAKHTIDILKMQMILPEFRPFIFKYAMHKPAEYLEHYASVETLLARAPMYTKKAYKPQKPRESKNKYQPFRTLEEARKALTAEQMETINSILATPSVAPFDVDLDAVILYTGAYGKQLVFLLEYLCFVEHMETTKPRMCTNSSGYLRIKLADGLHSVHNVFLGRPLHHSAIDGLRGGHGWGKVLDNRKRVLSAQTVGENNSQRGHADAKSVPGVVGVTKLKNGTFQAQIQSFFARNDTVYLGVFETAAEASAAYQFAYTNKAQLVKTCMDDPPAEVRARCRKAHVNFRHL